MIVGRKEEIAEIEKLYNSDRPEFVAIYGRRRVCKTFLVKQALKGRITFQHTGVSSTNCHGWTRHGQDSCLLSRTFGTVGAVAETMSCR